MQCFAKPWALVLKVHGKVTCDNFPMETLRRSKLVASLLLAWFALFLGSAIASSAIKPGNTQIVCSAGGGMKMVDLDGNEDGQQISATMDCPLCASVAAPLVRLNAFLIRPSALSHALQPLAAAHIAALTAPPLPSRGPPGSS